MANYWEREHNHKCLCNMCHESRMRRMMQITHRVVYRHLFGYDKRFILPSPHDNKPPTYQAHPD